MKHNGPMLGRDQSDVCANAPGWCRRRTRAALLLCVLAGTAMACSSDDSVPSTLSDWSRSAAWEHGEVIEFDNVATAGYRHTVSWATRPEDGDGASLSYWQVVQGAQPTEIALPPPDTPYVIPVSVAQESHRWAVAAVTRATPTGLNTGGVLWQGDGTTQNRAARPVELVLPRSVDAMQPDILSVARSQEQTVVVGLAGDEPVIWAHRQTESPPPAADQEARQWRGTPLEVEVESLANLQITADDEQFLLAGAGTDGQAHLWSSPDGDDWAAVSSDALPTDVSAVAMVNVLDEQDFAIGWRGAEGATPQTASTVSVTRFQDGEITDLDSIEAETTGDGEGYNSVDINDAVLAPDGDVLVAGEGVPSTDTSVPLIWAHHDGEWQLTRDEALTTRLDHRFQAIATTDTGMVAVMTHAHFADVELWGWED